MQKEKNLDEDNKFYKSEKLNAKGKKGKLIASGKKKKN